MSKTYDAIIIGAGISGMYQLYQFRKLGMSVKVYETGTGVGGTWYWNRYPGCRFDSESYSYGYSFDQEILDGWDWKEHFAPQPETLEYLNFVADKLDVRKDIQFNSRVASCTYDEAANEWEVTLASGEKARAHLLVSATGPLSAPQMPRIPGVDDFKGEGYHTANWPRDPKGFGPSKDISFAGKRIGIIGTGATGVQVIQEVSKSAQELFVFQRTPNWCAPLHNRRITPEENAEIHATYDKIFAKCNTSFGNFLHDFDSRSAVEVSAEEREAFFEELYASPGFGIWLGTFRDVLTDQKANDYASEFVARKIRSRVKDPKIAEKLIPKDHGFGLRRVPMETNYYECYNQPNVHLVDIKEAPIERITATGIKTTAENYDLDMIIYATGFEAVTGALARIEITGVGGVRLKDKWKNGIRAFLGMQSHGFPNFFTLVGPNNGASFCNIPRCIEQNVEWLTELVIHMRKNGLKRVENTVASEEAWARHIEETANATLFPTVNSWFMGVNENIPGLKRQFVAYAGGFPNYRKMCADIAAKGYEGFVLS
ncbi:MAG: NAD(P)/FAD-dependent oxidoreductase [Gammaproteobacteria bacterium]|nr:NAD(P)/FAD-dependent oxidoreductase [Gammaproteobacteria bacterium]MBI5617242.1 NAD(P)/FAD-dependent oxidoreductase [Gammaproteobacteria bacterium]